MSSLKFAKEEAPQNCNQHKHTFTLTTLNELDIFLKMTQETALKCTTALYLLTAWLAICHSILFIFALK